MYAVLISSNHNKFPEIVKLSTCVETRSSVKQDIAPCLVSSKSGEIPKTSLYSIVGKEKWRPSSADLSIKKRHLLVF